MTSVNNIHNHEHRLQNMSYIHVSEKVFIADSCNDELAYYHDIFELHDIICNRLGFNEYLMDSNNHCIGIFRNRT